MVPRASLAPHLIRQVPEVDAILLDLQLTVGPSRALLILVMPADTVDPLVLRQSRVLFQQVLAGRWEDCVPRGVGRVPSIGCVHEVRILLCLASTDIVPPSRLRQGVLEELSDRGLVRQVMSLGHARSLDAVFAHDPLSVVVGHAFLWRLLLHQAAVKISVVLDWVEHLFGAFLLLLRPRSVLSHMLGREHNLVDLILEEVVDWLHFGLEDWVESG